MKYSNKNKQISYNVTKMTSSKTIITMTTIVTMVTLLTLLFFQSQSTANNGPQNLTAALIGLQKHNNAIHTYYAKINSEGLLQKNKFRATGHIWSDAKKGRLKIKFEDLIFRAPMSIFLLIGNKVTLYYPPKKRKIVTSKARFRPAYDAGLPLEADLLQPMLQGHFFVPRYLTYKKYDAKNKKLILANKKYVINYLLNSRGLPYKGIFYNRVSKKRAVFTFQSYKKYQSTWIPMNIKIYPPIRGNYLTIKITALQINGKLGNVWHLK